MTLKNFLRGALSLWDVSQVLKDEVFFRNHILVIGERQLDEVLAAVLLFAKEVNR